MIVSTELCAALTRSSDKDDGVGTDITSGVGRIGRTDSGIAGIEGVLKVAASGILSRIGVDKDCSTITGDRICQSFDISKSNFSHSLSIFHYNLISTLCILL
jgi:hypothetical protein